jgi:hypothetical protein
MSSVVLMPFQSVLAKSNLSKLSKLNARDADRVALLADVLIDVTGKNPAIERLGTLYLRALSGRKPVEQMMQRIFASLPSDSMMGAEHLRRHFAALRQADFEAGHVVTVDGWVLAQSEADAITLVMLRNVN